MNNTSLPIKETLFRAVLLPLTQVDKLIKLTFPYIIFSFVSIFLIEDGQYTIGGWWVLVLGIVGVFTGVWAGVNCHRLFLLSSDRQDLLSAVGLTKRHRFFFFAMLRIVMAMIAILIPYMLLLAVLANAMGMAFADFTGSAWWAQLAFIPTGYFAARWSLVLPDSAVGENRSLSWSWQMTKKHHWRVFVLLSVIPVFTTTLNQLFVGIFEPSIFTLLTSGTLALVMGVIELCILSLTFAWLINDSPKDVIEPPPQAEPEEV